MLLMKGFNRGFPRYTCSTRARREDDSKAITPADFAPSPSHLKTVSKPW